MYTDRPFTLVMEVRGRPVEVTSTGRPVVRRTSLVRCDCFGDRGGVLSGLRPSLPNFALCCNSFVLTTTADAAVKRVLRTSGHGVCPTRVHPIPLARLKCDDMCSSPAARPSLPA